MTAQQIEEADRLELTIKRKAEDAQTSYQKQTLAVLEPVQQIVAYTAANAYMDAFAVARAREGTRWMSIDWDGWDFSGAQIDGRLALTRDEGMRVFQRLMAAPPAAQVAIYTEHWHHVSMIRKILLRMRSWQNYVFLEGH